MGERHAPFKHGGQQDLASLGRAGGARTRASPGAWQPARGRAAQRRVPQPSSHAGHTGGLLPSARRAAGGSGSGRGRGGRRRGAERAAARREDVRHRRDLNVAAQVVAGLSVQLLVQPRGFVQQQRGARAAAPHQRKMKARVPDDHRVVQPRVVGRQRAAKRLVRLLVAAKDAVLYVAERVAVLAHLPCVCV